MRAGKVWGSTELMLRTPFVEVHRVSIKPDSRCSMHSHRFRSNFFVVVSGRLFIEAQKLGYALTDITELGPRDSTTIPPNEKHRFFTRQEPCEAFEVYYPEPLGVEDIEREGVGSSGVGSNGAELNVGDASPHEPNRYPYCNCDACVDSRWEEQQEMDADKARK